MRNEREGADTKRGTASKRAFTSTTTHAEEAVSDHAPCVRACVRGAQAEGGGSEVGGKSARAGSASGVYDRTLISLEMSASVGSPCFSSASDATVWASCCTWWLVTRTRVRGIGVGWWW